MEEISSLDRSRLMWVWSDMKRRCHKESHQAYENYGGRGIAVCDRWRNSFSAFLEDMGPRPDPSLTLERVDNDAGYSPENCVWATRQEQGLNKRDYKSNTSGHRNIELEVRHYNGDRRESWRVRIRRGGKIIANRRFQSVDEAIRYRDQVLEEYRHARA